MHSNAQAALPLPKPNPISGERNMDTEKKKNAKAIAATFGAFVVIVGAGVAGVFAGDALARKILGLK